MPEAIAFETHRFVKRLTDCGFTEQQAEALADEHVTLLDANLATKVDLAELRADLLKWLIGALIARSSLIGALVCCSRAGSVRRCTTAGCPSVASSRST